MTDTAVVILASAIGILGAAVLVSNQSPAQEAQQVFRISVAVPGEYQMTVKGDGTTSLVRIR